MLYKCSEGKIVLKRYETKAVDNLHDNAFRVSESTENLTRGSCLVVFSHINPVGFFSCVF